MARRRLQRVSVRRKGSVKLITASTVDGTLRSWMINHDVDQLAVDVKRGDAVARQVLQYLNRH